MLLQYRWRGQSGHQVWTKWATYKLPKDHGVVRLFERDASVRKLTTKHRYVVRQYRRLNDD